MQDRHNTPTAPEARASLRLQYLVNLRWAFCGGALSCLGTTMLLDGHTLVGAMATIAGLLLARPKKLQSPSEEFWNP